MTAVLKLRPAEEDGWMQTLSGGRFTPLNPSPEEIRLTDIAGALSKMCRYGGHCLKFYSVAEHCVLMAQAAKPEHQLTALMHDASEAYISDIIRPLKPHLKGYYEHEDRLMEVIAKRFGFIYPLPAEVKKLDMQMLRDERIQNMTHMDVPPEVWGDALEGTGVQLQFWSPHQAEFQFLRAFKEYGGQA